MVSGHVHRWEFDPCKGLTSKGHCQCGAEMIGRNYLSQDEANRLLMMNRPTKEDEMTASAPVATSASAPQPIPLEFSVNDMYICAFGFRLSPELRGQPVDRIEFSGDAREIKRLQEVLRAGTVTVTLKFAGGY